MKFPRKCVDCERLATERVSFNGKTHNVCDTCAKKIRRLGGQVPETAFQKPINHDTIRIYEEVDEINEIDLSILTEENYNEVSKS